MKVLATTLIPNDTAVNDAVRECRDSLSEQGYTVSRYWLTLEGNNYIPAPDEPPTTEGNQRLILNMEAESQ